MSEVGTRTEKKRGGTAWQPFIPASREHGNGSRGIAHVCVEGKGVAVDGGGWGWGVGGWREQQPSHVVLILFLAERGSGAVRQLRLERG